MIYHIIIHIGPIIMLILLKFWFSPFSTCLKAHSVVSSRKKCPSYAYIVAIYINDLLWIIFWHRKL